MARQQKDTETFRVFLYAKGEIRKKSYLASICGQLKLYADDGKKYF